MKKKKLNICLVIDACEKANMIAHLRQCGCKAEFTINEILFKLNFDAIGQEFCI